MNKNNIKLNTAKAYYITNAILALMVLISIYLMFHIQFRVNNLQEKVSEVDNKIVAYEDEIRVLQVEWVYLTRPERLRILSEKYLNNSDYIASNQVKNVDKLQPYYLSNLEKYESKQLAMNQ
jgi:hypothetical protein